MVKEGYIGIRVSSMDHVFVCFGSDDPLLICEDIESVVLCYGLELCASAFLSSVGGQLIIYVEFWLFES